MQSLKTVQLKLKESRDALDSINDKTEGKATLFANSETLFTLFCRKVFTCSNDQLCIPIPDFIV